MRPSQIHFALSLLLVAGRATGLQAQTAQSAVAPAAPAPAEQAARWDLVISDGVLMRRGSDNSTGIQATLRHVVDHLRDRFPANVVLGPGAGDVQISDLKLALFQWEPALEALRVASGNAFTWRSHPERPPAIDPVTGLSRQLVRSDSDLYILEVNPAKPREQAHEVEVFNLAHYLQDQDEKRRDDSLAELQMIIAHTVESAGARGQPSFRYHGGAGLLVVTGTPEQLEIARKILLALPQVSASRAVTPASAPAVSPEVLRRYGMWQDPPPSAVIPTRPLKLPQAAPLPGAGVPVRPGAPPQKSK